MGGEKRLARDLGGQVGTNTKDESQSKTESQFKLSLETVGKRTKMGLKR